MVRRGGVEPVECEERVVLGIDDQRKVKSSVAAVHEGALVELM